MGEEAGFKVNGANEKISGSVSAYRNDAKDTQFNGGGNLASFVSPNGLNGPLPDGTGGSGPAGFLHAPSAVAMTRPASATRAHLIGVPPWALGILRGVG